MHLEKKKNLVSLQFKGRLHDVSLFEQAEVYLRISCASGCDNTQRYAFGARLCGISASPQVVVVVGVVVVQIPSLHNVSCPLCLSGSRIIYGQSDL